MDAEALPSPSSPSCQPIDAKPLRSYPPLDIVSQCWTSSSSDQSSLATETLTSAYSLSVNYQSPEANKDGEDIGISRNEILIFGVKIKTSNSDSSLSVSTVDDQQLLQNQKYLQGKCSRNGFRLFGVWVSKTEGREKKKLGMQETSKPIKKRAYTPRPIKKRALDEENAERRAERVLGSYKENIGELLAEKVLTKSDIDQSSRLLLSREKVEKRLIPILNQYHPGAEQHCKSLEGLRIQIWDADTDHESGESYTLVLKQWATKSFVFTGSWKKYVKSRNLKEDDEIGLFLDHNQHRLYFSVKQIGF
jgi:hypothetical protein